MSIEDEIVEKYRGHFEQITSDAVADERERCAVLCEKLAELHEARARDDRTPRRGLIFKSVSPYRERIATYRDAAASSLRTVARLIRDGLSDARP